MANSENNINEEINIENLPHLNEIEEIPMDENGNIIEDAEIVAETETVETTETEETIDLTEETETTEDVETETVETAQPASNYTLTTIKPRPGMKQTTIDKMITEMEQVCPEMEGIIVNHDGIDYSIIGKHTRGKNCYLFEHSNNTGGTMVTTALLIDNTPRARKPKASRSVQRQQQIAEPIDPMKLDVVQLGDIDYNPDLFVPMLSGTAMDKVFSKRGGVMPATNYILIGDPGIGKTTLGMEYIAQVQNQNPEKRILFVSGEMTRIDLFEYIERFQDWKNISTVFVSEFVDGTYKESIEALFNQGWDLILIDSFAEITDSVKEDQNEYHFAKMSSTGAEKWLIDLFVTHNMANNEAKRNTSFLTIQQVTKGGKFVGSNKLKHNTTGMVEFRFDKSGERKIIVSKNRRGFEYTNLYFKLNETGEPLTFDVARIEREKELQAKIEKEREELLNDENRIQQLFDTENNIETQIADTENEENE